MNKNKKVLYSLLIIAGILFFFIVSGIFISKNFLSGQKEYISLDSYTNLNQPAVCGVDYFNNISVDSMEQPFILYTNQLLNKSGISGNIESHLFLVIKGWAVDPEANDCAGGVLIDVNKTLYKAHYGLPNFQSQYSNSGFECRIPLSDLTYFPRTLSIKVLNRNKTGYYPYQKTYTFLIMENPLPDLKDIMQAVGSTQKAVDTINGIPASGKIIISKNSAFFTVEGWAVDTVNEYLAGGVYISIDNSMFFTSVYGFERQDIAKNLNNLQFTFSGFHAAIPTKDLSIGLHKLSIYILQYNKKSFFVPDGEISFEIQ